MSLPLILGYPLFLVAGLEVILGVLLLKQNFRNSRVNKSVAAFSFLSAAFSLSGACMYVRFAKGLDHIPFARFNWIGWFTIPAALQFVFYLREESSRMARIVGWVLYPFWTILLGLSLATDLIVTDHYVLIPFENSPGPIENPARFIGGLLIVWLMIEIIRLRKQVVGIKRAQLNYFFHGILVFGTLGSMSAGFLQLFGGFGFEPGLTAYFSFPWVVLTFYAITRYRLFDIRIVISNTISIAFLSGLFAAFHVVLFHAFAPVIGSTAAILLSMFALVLVFFGTPFSSRIRLLIQKTILKDKYLYQDVLKESIKAIVTILDFDELLDYIVVTIRKSLQVRGVSIYLKNTDGKFILRHGAGDPPSEVSVLDGRIVELVQQTGQAVVREEVERILPDQTFGELNRLLKNAGAELIIPLRYKGQLQGILTLGWKGNGEPFVQSDIDLLDALAGHAAVAIENARLYDDARRAHESLRESEARISAIADYSIRKYLSE